MSLKKFTVKLYNAASWEKDAHYLMDRIETGIENVNRLGNRLIKIAQLISFLEQFPDEDVQKAIALHMDGEKCLQVKKTGRDQLQYWIPNLYIHETIA